MSDRAYADFLATKRPVALDHGRPVDPVDIHPSLFDFQRDLVVWAVRKGRAALLADAGLGKTRMQLEWARLIGERTLILAPLTVAEQTVAEALAIDLDVVYARGWSLGLDLRLLLRTPLLMFRKRETS